MTKNLTETKGLAIWWVKRDFRLSDNQALLSALLSNDIVLPVYLYEPLLLQGPDWGSFHTQAISGAVASLSKNLKHFNSQLLVFNSSPIDAVNTIEQIIAKKGFTVKCVYSHEETGLTHTYERDKAFKSWCKSRGIDWHEHTNNGVIRGPIDRNFWEKRFTQYMLQDCLKVPKNRLSESFPQILKDLFFDKGVNEVLANDIPVPSSDYMKVGERSGNLILKDFLSNRGRKYRGGISSMNKATEACSRLSAQIAWGSLSLRTVLYECDKRLKEIEEDNTSAVKQWKLSLHNFRSRLFWHAHFVQKLENQVDMEFYAVNKAFRNSLPYIYEHTDGAEHHKRLQAWLYGQTGFPAIDAAMRYYQQYGWLNFRSRAMITSFACNALRLPWQTVLYELSKLMYDYVPGIHVSQVQMQAGVTGINTIRVYSPQKQLQDHDPHCSFVYRMIPELRSVKPAQILSLSNEYSTPAYAKQIIDFKQESKIMKDALYQITKSDYCAKEAKQVFVKHGSRRRSFSRRKQTNTKAKKIESAQLKLF